MAKLLSESQPDEAGGEHRVFQVRRIACANAWRPRDMVCPRQPTTQTPVELIS